MRYLLLAVTLSCLPGCALPAQELDQRQRQSLADSIALIFGDKIERAMRGANADSILALYGRPAEFVNIEDGEAVPYARMAAEIREFTRQVTSANVRWEGRPTVLVLNRNAAVIYGVHRFEGGAGQPPHSGIWSGVLQRIDRHWRIVHAHGSDVPAR